MIKRFVGVLRKGFDTDQENIDRVTKKDVFVGVPVLYLVSFVITLPLLPLFLLMEAFELLFVLFFLGCVFASPITLYRIFQGDGTLVIWLLFLTSTFVLIAYFVLFPLAKRHPMYKRLVSSQL